MASYGEAAKTGLLATLQSIPGVLEVTLDDRNISLSLVDPEEQNPLIVSALVSMGAKIEYVQEVKHGLEDIYLKLMGGSK